MSYRKLHINNQIWLYVIGKSGVKIKNPENKSTYVKAHEILNILKIGY
jgi:hypothetical protein